MAAALLFWFPDLLTAVIEQTACMTQYDEFGTIHTRLLSQIVAINTNPIS